MRAKFLLLFVVSCFVFQGVEGQNNQNKKFYFTSGGEMIFSFASIDDNGNTEGNPMRWTPWFNVQSLVNYDPTRVFGLFSGVNVRNIGFIYDNYVSPVTGDKVKKKFRTYDVGIPIGFKLGNLDGFMFFGGYEIEFPITYKEKTFQNEKKTEKFTVWFSKRVPTVYHTLMAGVQFPYGFNLKFKYYLTNFHNKDYAETINGTEYKPYENLNANVFYFSLSFNLFKDTKFYYTESNIK